jgi:hypothetical protein
MSYSLLQITLLGATCAASSCLTAYHKHICNAPSVQKAHIYFCAFLNEATKHVAWSDALKTDLSPLLDWNGGAARAAKAIFDNELQISQRSNLPALAREVAGSAFCAVSGSLAGGFIAKQVGRYSKCSKETQVHISRIGAIFTGVMTWYFTRSPITTMMNAFMCALVPALDVRDCK